MNKTDREELRRKCRLMGDHNFKRDLLRLLDALDEAERKLAEAGRVYHELKPETVEEMEQEIARLNARISDRRQQTHEQFKEEIGTFRP